MQTQVIKNDVRSNAKSHAKDHSKDHSKGRMKKDAEQMITLALEKNAALLIPAAPDAALARVYASEDGRLAMLYLQRRTLAQNACMWSLLTDISKQVNWRSGHLSKEEWKHLLAASLKRRRMVLLKTQGQPVGELVNMATSTSCMNVDEMSEFIDYVVLFGLTQNVVFSGAQKNACDRKCASCSSTQGSIACA